MRADYHADLRHAKLAEQQQPHRLSLIRCFVWGVIAAGVIAAGVLGFWYGVLDLVGEWF